MAGAAAGHGVAGLTLALSSSSRSVAICWALTLLCSSRARCVDSTLDCSALTRQRSYGQVRAEEWVPLLPVKPDCCADPPASPTLCHKHLLSREIQKEGPREGLRASC